MDPADLTGYQGVYIANGKRGLSKKGLASCGARPLPAGTVLYSSRAPIGYCAIASNPIATNQGFKSLVLRTRVFSSINAGERSFGDLIAVGPQNGLYLPKTSYGSGTPILRIENYGFEQTQPIAEWKRVKVPKDQTGRYDLAINDIIINRVNSPSHLGKSMVVTKDHIPAVFESNMMRIQIGGEVLPDYVQTFLASDYGRIRLTKNAKWAVNAIRWQVFRDLIHTSAEVIMSGQYQSRRRS